MGKDEKVKKAGNGKEKTWKKTRRGKPGKGSAFTHEQLKKLSQRRRTAGKRQEHRQERSTEPSVAVAKRLVPSLPHDAKLGELDVHRGLADYYRKISPGNHPYLKLVELTKGEMRVVAVRDILTKEVGLKLCCVLGELTRVEPEPHCGIKLGHGEYINFSNVRYDLGYHGLKPPHKYVESMAAEPNYSHYIRCRNSDDLRTNCKLEADPGGQRVVWFKTIRHIRRGEEVMVEYDPVFFPSGKEEAK